MISETLRANNEAAGQKRTINDLLRRCVCMYTHVAPWLHYLEPCTHDQICIRMQILHICKSGHVYAFTHVCKICTYAKVEKFAPASGQVQISFCVYAKFAYMQIWSCEQKAKFAHVSIYLILLNNC